ncbi:MAG: ABC transporter permease subunit [Phycisphaerales bacterium]|nr:ABC transporter permease subunit [Phycisphaerales bacterium]
MSASAVIAGREFRSFFRLPVGWVVIALYAALTGVVFAAGTLQPGGVATMRDFFALSAWLMLPVTPAISMRLFAEEARSGTLESLATSPVSDAQVVLGKYLGALAFLVAVLVPTLAFVATLWAVADPRPEVGPIVAGYLSLVLLGGLYLAVGTLASALTSNQTLAFLLTFFFLVALLLASGTRLDFVPDWAQRAFYAVSIQRRVAEFAKGIVGLGDTVFFISGAACFLALAWGALESRRWR